MLHILLAEDHTIIRTGVKMLLELDPNIKIAAEAKNGTDALNLIANGVHVDIVIADINMPELGGIGLTKALSQNYPKIKVVILSMHDNEKYVFEAFSEGAYGYLLKNISADELVFALKYIGNGHKYQCAELSMNMLNKVMYNGYPIAAKSASVIDFSAREIEVLHLIAEGLTNSEIADRLFVSKRTIEGHRQSLLEKTATRNTAALIRYAILNGVVH